MTTRVSLFVGCWGRGRVVEDSGGKCGEEETEDQ